MGYPVLFSPALYPHVARCRCERFKTSFPLSSVAWGLVVFFVVLHFIASPAHCASITHKMTPHQQQQQQQQQLVSSQSDAISSSYYNNVANSDDVMLSDDPQMLLLTRSRRTFMGSKDDRFSLVNGRGDFYLVLRPDGHVLGEKAASHHHHPAYSVLMHEIVETDCVAKHCVQGPIVKIREMTSHTYLCVNKSGHFYGKRWEDTSHVSADCWFVQMLDEAGHVAYYSATHGSGRGGEVHCNSSSTSTHPHNRHRVLRHRRQVTGDKKKKWQQATSCQQWFVSMKDNGQLKRAQRSESPASRSWKSSTFLVLSRQHSLQPAQHERGLEQTGQHLLPAATALPSAKGSGNRVKDDGGKKKHKGKAAGKKRRNRKRGKGKKGRKCSDEMPFSSCKTKSRRGQGNKDRSKAKLPFIN